MNPLYNQQHTEISDLLNRRQTMRTKAERLVEELNWRLNPAGGPEAIDMEKVLQAIQELDEAHREIHQMSAKLTEYPPEFQHGRRL